jgi:hypothetical protein
MADTVQFTRGNTFACSFLWTPGATGPANLLATTITSTIEDKCGAQYETTVTKAGDGLSFTVAFVGDTSNWHLGLGRWDIKFVFSGSPGPISRSQIFRINVIEAVTA